MTQHFFLSEEKSYSVVVFSPTCSYYLCSHLVLKVQAGEYLKAETFARSAARQSGQSEL